MAQSGYTPIQLYYSTTAAAAPTAGNLTNGELGINITDEKLYFKNAAGVVKLLASNASSSGTVSSVAQSFTGGLISVAGSPITTSGTLALTVAGTSGGIPYFSSGTTWASSSVLTASNLMIGGGAGAAPSTTTTGTGVVTALGINVGTAGAFVVNGGALGTPSSGTVTNLTGTASININGTVGATTPSTGAFTSVTENGYAVVSQADIGTAANEIPLNQYLGSMAYQDGTNYYNVGMTVGFRNRIINGAMMIDQRNAGASVTVNTFNVFAVDRFNLETGGATGGGVYTAQRSTVAPSNFVNSLLCTVTTADSSLASGDLSQLSQYIEGLNVADLGWGTSAAKPVTLSFWVRSSVTGPFSVGFQNATNDRANVGVYTINTANTWEYKTITVSGDTSGTWNTSTGIGISLRFCFATGDARVTASPYTWVGANAIAISSTANPLMGTLGATFYITGVQLEVGTQATPFDWRPYGTELQLCQRYYESSNTTGSVPYLPFACYNSTNMYGSFQYRVTKRATPTVAFNATAWEPYSAGVPQTFTSVTNDGIGISNVAIVILGSGWTTGNSGFARNSGLNAIQISAEL